MNIKASQDWKKRLDDKWSEAIEESFIGIGPSEIKDFIQELLDEKDKEVVKYQRREDEHCRQIDRKDMKIRSLELILAVQPRHLGD